MKQILFTISFVLGFSTFVFAKTPTVPSIPTAPVVPSAPTVNTAPVTTASQEMSTQMSQMSAQQRQEFTSGMEKWGSMTNDQKAAFNKKYSFWKNMPESKRQEWTSSYKGMSAEKKNELSQSLNQNKENMAQTQKNLSDTKTNLNDSVQNVKKSLNFSLPKR